MEAAAKEAEVTPSAPASAAHMPSAAPVVSAAPMSDSLQQLIVLKNLQEELVASHQTIAALTQDFEATLKMSDRSALCNSQFVQPGPAAYDIRGTMDKFGEDRMAPSYTMRDRTKIVDEMAMIRKNPGPGAYEQPSALNKQLVSTRRSCPTNKFGKSQRFGRDTKHDVGPGKYDAASSFGKQSTAKQRSSKRCVFGRDKRRTHQARGKIDVPFCQLRSCIGDGMMKSMASRELFGSEIPDKHNFPGPMHKRSPNISSMGKQKLSQSRTGPSWKMGGRHNMVKEQTDAALLNPSIRFSSRVKKAPSFSMGARKRDTARLRGKMKQFHTLHSEGFKTTRSTEKKMMLIQTKVEQLQESMQKGGDAEGLKRQVDQLQAMYSAELRKVTGTLNSMASRKQDLKDWGFHSMW